MVTQVGLEPLGGVAGLSIGVVDMPVACPLAHDFTLVPTTRTTRQALPRACAVADDLGRRVDGIDVGEQALEIDVEVREQVDLVDDHHVGGANMTGYFSGFSSPSVTA